VRDELEETADQLEQTAEQLEQTSAQLSVERKLFSFFLIFWFVFVFFLQPRFYLCISLM